MMEIYCMFSTQYNVCCCIKISTEDTVYRAPLRLFLLLLLLLWQEICMWVEEEGWSIASNKGQFFLLESWFRSWLWLESDRVWRIMAVSRNKIRQLLFLLLPAILLDLQAASASIRSRLGAIPYICRYVPLKIHKCSGWYQIIRTTVVPCNLLMAFCLGAWRGLAIHVLRWMLKFNEKDCPYG